METRRFVRFHSIFNAEQVSGLPEPLFHFSPIRPLDEALLEAEAFIGALGANVRHGGDEAGYVPASDTILMSNRDQFESDARYVVTKLHEHGHWTGHKSRLDHDLTGELGGAAYAGEELIAELTAAFLSAELQIPGELRHPEYMA